MQIDCLSENSITFKITDDGDGAIDTFYGILNKCKIAAEKKGFNNMFDSNEKEFIKELTNTLLNNET